MFPSIICIHDFSDTIKKSNIYLPNSDQNRVHFSRNFMTFSDFYSFFLVILSSRKKYQKMRKWLPKVIHFGHRKRDARIHFPTFSDLAPEGLPDPAKARPKHPFGPLWAPSGSPLPAKGSQKGAEGTRRGPEGRQREPKESHWEPKGVTEPSVDSWRI